MTLIYRSEKGSPLSIEEVDGNFKNLDERLSHLEKNEDPTDPQKFFWIQTQEIVSIQNEKGKEIGSFQLQPTPFHPKGPWKPLQDYFSFDLVSFPGQVFCCLKNHTSGESFKKDSEEDLWILFLDVLPLLRKK